MSLYEEQKPGDLLKWVTSKKQEKAKAAAESSFYEFIQQAWDQVDPANPFQPNWHVGAIAETLESVSLGQIKQVVINMPPGGAKSLLVCVFYPAWEWIRNPMIRYMTGSYSEEFSIRDSMRARRLMESEWYQKRWGDRFRLGGNDLQSLKGRYENDKSGYRIAFGINSGLGERGDRLIIDDAHKTKQAISDAEREQAVESYRNTMTTRANNINTAAWIIVMQRLHERDLAGQMLEFGYEHLCIPMRYDPSRPWTKLRVQFQHVDPRTTYGEILFPARWPEHEVQRMERLLGSYNVSGQFQQRPSPADGGIYKRAWFSKYWCRPDDKLTAPTIRIADTEVETELVRINPSELEEQAISFDMTFKDVKDSDYVVGQVWGRRGANRFLLDQVRARMDFPATLEAVRALSKAWPKAGAKYVEDKANGSAVISSLKHEISGLVAVNPSGGKESRAQAVSPQFEAGNVWLPHPSIAPWVGLFIEEHIAFPNAAHDDMCFVGGTLIATPKGDIPIERVRRGDRVITPSGLSTVTAAGCTGFSSIREERGLAGTPSHRFFTWESGFVRMDALTQFLHHDNLSLWSLIRWRYLKLLNSTESSSGEWAGRESIISASRLLTREEKIPRDFMSRFGNFIMDGKFLKALTFITRTIILSTTTLIIWTAYRSMSIAAISRHGYTKGKRPCSRIFLRFVRLLRHGTLPKKESHGIGNTARKHGSGRKPNLAFVYRAARNFSRFVTPFIAEPAYADTGGASLPGIITSPESASYAKGSLTQLWQPTPSRPLQHAASNAKLCSHGKPATLVYNLSVEGDGCYYANGILVSNCDAASQLLNQWLGGWLGVIQYLKSEFSREESMKHKKEAVATGDQTVRCPECGSMAVQIMRGDQGKRCGNCGNQFDRPAGLYSPPKRGQELQKSR